MPVASIPMTFGRHGVELDVAAGDPELHAKFIADVPLNSLEPPDVTLGRLAARAKVEPLTLGAAGRTLAFEAHGGVSAAIATCDSAADVLQEAGLADALDALQLVWPETGRFIAAASQYDIAAAATGTMALGALPGSVTAGASTSRMGRFAVIQRVPDEKTGLRTAAQTLLAAAALPKDIETAHDLAPDTWIVAEVDGALSASVGAELGYSFNWIREVGNTAIGDIGLKVRLATELAYSVRARSRFLLVITRGVRPGSAEPIQAENRVRLQVLRTRQTNKAGALSIGAGAQLAADLPGSPTEFLEAAFGLRVEQLLKDVRRMLAAVTNPASAADAMLSLAGPEIERLLETLEPARERLAAALQAWDDLGSVAADAVTEAIDAIGAAEATASLQNLLKTLVSVQGPQELAAAIRREMDERRFPGSAAERWLWAVVERGPLDLLVDGRAWQRVHLAARATLDVIDGTAATALVETLKSRITADINIDAIRKAAGPDALDRWLRARLEAFLGRTLDPGGLTEIRQAIDLLEAQGAEVYRQLVDAATDEYSASLKAALSVERTREAVLDLEFDTAGESGRSALASAIRGDFGSMLLHPPDGVTVHAGLLTNGVERRRSVAVTLPFFSTRSETVTRAFASLSVTREGAAVLLLDARNEVRSRARTSSTLAVRAELPIRGVDVHGRTGGFAYSFRQFTPDVRTEALASQLETYARTYFAEAFSTDGAFDRVRFDEWIEAMERSIDEQTTRWSGRRLFGTTVVGLDIQMPGRAIVAWTHAPASKADPAYYTLSLALQNAVRNWLFFYFACQIGRFVKERSDAFLVFTAMPAFNHGLERRFREYELVNGQGRLFWDITDPHLRSAVIRSPLTKRVLDARLQYLRTALEQQNVSTGRRFTIEEVIRSVEERKDLGQRERLEAMLIALRDLITGAADAARRARAAMDAHHDDQALEHLQLFGEKLTKTFNKSLGGFFIDEVNFRPFSSLIFLEAARVFDPGLDQHIVAQLSVAALTETATFTEQDLLSGKAPSQDQLIFDERLVRAGGTTG